MGVGGHVVADSFSDTVISLLGSGRTSLFVNGSTGGPERTVRIAIGETAAVEMRAFAAGPSPAHFVCYAWTDVPDATTWTTLPFNLGASLLPTPLSGLAPQPAFVWNTTRFAGLGVPDRVPRLAPTAFVSRALGRAVQVTLQGIIEDDGSTADKPGSLTNAVLLEVR